MTTAPRRAAQPKRAASGAGRPAATATALAAPTATASAPASASATATSTAPAAATGPVTIRDVAALCGLSIKTVSRVLNHEPRVTPETRGRVESAVARLGYSPHPAARNLSRSVSTTLGLAFPAWPDTPLVPGQQYTMDILYGALAACQRLGVGLQLLPCDTQRGGAAIALRAQAHAQRIAGVVVVSPLDAQPGLLESLVSAGLSVACLDANDIDNSAVPVVAVDDEHAARQMTDLLLARGHRRIAFVGGLARTRTARQREAGYRAAMAAAGLSVDPRWVRAGEFAFNPGRAAGAALLALQPRPTAVLAANDEMAIGVMHAAHSIGLALPQDLSVAGFDDIASASLVWPPLTTMRQPLRLMAAAAVEQLAGLLFPQRLNVPPQPRLRLFKCELVLRESIAPPPEAPSALTPG